MLPAPRPPTRGSLDTHKTRALTTIYAPRKLKPRKNKTAQSRMLDDLPIKPTLSPFHPLPAIGQKLDDKPKTKVIVFDMNKNETPTALDRIKLHDVLKPLTPLRIHGYTRKNALDDQKPHHQLLRENTYDVIEPIYVNAAKVKTRDRTLSRGTVESLDSDSIKMEKVSPKTRFKKAALTVAKLSSMPETGKLLCLREKQAVECRVPDGSQTFRLQELPRSPAHKLTELSEIFQNLDMRGRHRDKMKKENSWF